MKRKIKIAVDILMAAALPMLMCYSIVGETTHEVIGILMFCLFIAHHILNFGWIKTLFKGRYNLRRSMNTTINVIIFVCLIGLMYSGIVISKHIFTFINHYPQLKHTKIPHKKAGISLCIIPIDKNKNAEKIGSRYCFIEYTS